MTHTLELPLATAHLALREELHATCGEADEKRKQIDEALRSPASMPLWIFQSVRNRLMDMLVLQHRGQGNAPGFAERLRFLDRLVTEAPWVVDPDIGVLPKNAHARSASTVPASAAAMPAIAPQPAIEPWPATVVRRTSKSLK